MSSLNRFDRIRSLRERNHFSEDSGSTDEGSGQDESKNVKGKAEDKSVENVDEILHAMKIQNELERQKPTKKSNNPQQKLDREQSDDDDELSELDKKIIRQVEFYFGDYNLPKDRFMLDLMDENEGWILMETMMTFKRLAMLTPSSKQVLKSLKKSDSNLMEIDVGRNQIRRNPNLVFPKMDDARRLSLQERTVFVAGFEKSSTSLDDLIEFFEKGFEKVGTVRMRTERPFNNNNNEQKTGKEEGGLEHPPKFLGSVFVTFTTRQAAQTFINLCVSKEGVFCQGRRLFAKWQKDFLNERTQTNDEFNPDTINRTVFVHGFDKQETSGEELAEFFGIFPGACTVRKRVYRDRKENYGEGEEAELMDWKFTGSVFVTFETPQFARDFLEIKDLKYHGDGLRSKWQKEFFEEKGKFKRQMNEFCREDSK